jgi:hypothetical protein
MTIGHNFIFANVGAPTHQDIHIHTYDYDGIRYAPNRSGKAYEYTFIPMTMTWCRDQHITIIYVQRLQYSKNGLVTPVHK